MCLRTAAKPPRKRLILRRFLRSSLSRRCPAGKVPHLGAVRVEAPVGHEKSHAPRYEVPLLRARILSRQELMALWVPPWGSARERLPERADLENRNEMEREKNSEGTLPHSTVRVPPFRFPSSL